MRLVLLGDPVAHSRSPAIQQAALDSFGIGGIYAARRVDDAGLAAALAEIRSGRLHGANVTMPHKRLAFAACDAHAPDAIAAGAVNTVLRRDGVLYGDLTDVAGIRDAWSWAALPDDVSVLVLGAGGAAAAALVALAGRDRFVSARRTSGAEALAADHSGTRVHPWGEALPGAVLVNATPLGMNGEQLPPAVLRGASGLFDMAYGPFPTPAVVAAAQRGLPVAAGVDMLLAQAAASFRLWTGRSAPVTVMRGALAS